MAKSAPTKPLRLSPWPKGVNQRLAPISLPAGTLREAVNVTLDAHGTPRRRAGYTKRLAGVALAFYGTVRRSAPIDPSLVAPGLRVTALAAPVSAPGKPADGNSPGPFGY